MKVNEMWTIGGYAQDLVKRHLIEVVAPDPEIVLVDQQSPALPSMPGMLEAHKDKLKVNIFTQKGRDDPVAGFLGVGLSCPVKMPVYSGSVEKLMAKAAEFLALPYYYWNVGPSKVRGCVTLHAFFGMNRTELEEADEAQAPPF